MRESVLIGDCGGTSCKWAVIGHDVRRFKTAGYNFARQPIESWQLPEVCNIDEIEIYGAGLTPDRCQGARQYLQSLFPQAKRIFCGSDLLGAAKALCGTNSGVVCILGTGSAVCHYDGHDIDHRTPSLGYLVGDEGSGTALGHQWVKMAVRGQIPGINLDESQVLGELYHGENPARYLSSFCPEILEKASKIPQVSDMVVNCFLTLCHNCLQEYSKSVEVNFSGSVAYNFQSYLHKALLLDGRSIGRVIAEPLTALVNQRLRDQKG